MSTMSDRVCQFYLRGRCQRENCEFRHDRSKVAAADSRWAGAGRNQICRFYQMGNCKFRDSCRSDTAGPLVHTLL